MYNKGVKETIFPVLLQDTCRVNFRSVMCVSTEKAGSMSGDSGHGSSQTDAYDELFHTPNTVDLDPLDNEQEENGNKVGFRLFFSSLFLSYQN